MLVIYLNKTKVNYTHAPCDGDAVEKWENMKMILEGSLMHVSITIVSLNFDKKHRSRLMAE